MSQVLSTSLCPFKTSTPRARAGQANSVSGLARRASSPGRPGGPRPAALVPEFASVDDTAGTSAAARPPTPQSRQRLCFGGDPSPRPRRHRQFNRTLGLARGPPERRRGHVQPVGCERRAGGRRPDRADRSGSDAGPARSPRDSCPRDHSPLGRLPGVNELPARPEMPDVLVMNDGTRVTAPRQWQTAARGDQADPRVLRDRPDAAATGKRPRHGSAVVGRARGPRTLPTRAPDVRPEGAAEPARRHLHAGVRRAVPGRHPARGDAAGSARPAAAAARAEPGARPERAAARRQSAAGRRDAGADAAAGRTSDGRSARRRATPTSSRAATRWRSSTTTTAPRTRRCATPTAASPSGPHGSIPPIPATTGAFSPAGRGARRVWPTIS